MLTLYGDKRSGNCQKVAVLCDLLGLDYRWAYIDIM